MKTLLLLLAILNLSLGAILLKNAEYIHALVNVAIGTWTLVVYHAYKD